MLYINRYKYVYIFIYIDVSLSMYNTTWFITLKSRVDNPF